MIVKYTTVVAAVLMHTYVICAMAGIQPHQDISTKQADSVIRNSKDVVVLDVRTPEEYRLGHLQNAVSMDIYDSKFHYSANTLPKEATILVYSRSGRRSADAVEILKNLRYPRVLNMLGGIVAWKNEGRRVVKG
jgi:rhodanese-related sulfurtransferase